MDAELEKIVESGKLTSKAAEQLEKLQPGTFCLHKSWGFGRVAEWSLLLNQIVIDFAGKKSHPMQLQYAAANLTPLSAEHFLARKANDLPSIKKLVKEDAPTVVRSILESLGGKATVQQISEWLLGDVFNEAEWKRWWESTKKSLKKEGSFSIPVKKNEPILLRATPVSHAEELIAFFNQARQSKEQAAALDQIVKFYSEFKEPEKQLQPIVAAVETTATRNQKLHPALTFEFVLGRDDLLERVPQLKTTNHSLRLSKLITDEEPRLISILPKLPAAKEKRVLQALPEALGERWTIRALQLMNGNHPRLVAQIAKVFVETGREAELRAALERSIGEHSVTSEVLVWLCHERESVGRGFITPELLAAILAAVERDQHTHITRGSKLRDLLVDDRELMTDMFTDADIGVARDAMRRLMVTPVLDELTKRSLLARIVKLYPELESMITAGKPEEKSASLIVSWSSLEKRRAEYEELIKKKIPENTKEIAIARSYGDMRENFEFKAAKQMQAVLSRRKAEVEQMLHLARGTAFENPDTTRVSIGTIVSLRDSKSAKEEAYTILGAWDGDPERHIISYQTAIAQSLLGHKLGEIITLTTDKSPRQFAIISIEAAPRDETPPDPSLTETALEEVAAE